MPSNQEGIMAGSAPETSNWKAAEDRQPPGARLRVTGTVTTTMSNQEPRLTKANPQGINPSILLLDLTIATTGDIGSAVMGKPEVQYREDITAGQYTGVEIRYEGQSLAFIDHIEVVH
jgi:hypothetical protein